MGVVLVGAVGSVTAVLGNTDMAVAARSRAADPRTSGAVVAAGSASRASTYRVALRHCRAPPLVTDVKGRNSHGRPGWSGAKLATWVSRDCARVTVPLRTSWVRQVKSACG